MVTRGDRRHEVTVQNPPAPVSNNDGGFVYPEPWIDLDPPTLHVSLRVATPGDTERVGTGTTTAITVWLMSGDYHPQVTTQTRVVFEGQTYSILGVSDPDLQHVEMECLLATVPA